MAEIINDERYLRILNALGLRGIVQHEYEPTVLPVVVVGNFPQPLNQTILPAGGPLNSPILTVPRGETWQLISAYGAVSQTGGLTAGTYRLAQIQPAGVTTFYPYQFTATSPLISQAGTLNTIQSYFCQFPPYTMFPEGSLLSLQTGGGADGSLTYSGIQVVTFFRFLERLLESQP